MKKTLILIFAFVLIAVSCGKDNFNGYDNRLHILNNSNISIYFAPFDSYPDTSLYGRGVVPTSSAITYKVSAHTTEKLSVNCCWEDIISDLPCDTLMLFIFDAKVLETTPWDTVKAKYLVLKRYDLSLQDLEDMNWTITYP